MRRVLIAGVVLLGLAGCGSKTACYSLSDGDAVDRIMRDYDSEPATQKGDPAQMKFSRTRVLGVGRDGKSKGGGSLIQLWFAQDDHTVTVATLMENCDLSYHPGLTPDAIKDATYPAQPPKF
jgi:hypothetical protein